MKTLKRKINVLQGESTTPAVLLKEQQGIKEQQHQLLKNSDPSLTLQFHILKKPCSHSPASSDVPFIQTTAISF